MWQKIKMYCAKQYLENHKTIYEMAEKELKDFHKYDNIIKITTISSVTYAFITSLINNFTHNQILINYMSVPILIELVIGIFVIIPYLVIKLIHIVICDLITIVCYKIDNIKDKRRNKYNG